MYLGRRFSRRLLVLAAVSTALITAAAAYATVRITSSGPVTANVTPASAKQAVTGSGHMSAKVVTARTFTRAPTPTPAQLQAAKEGLKEQENVPAPNRVTTNAQTNPGPAVQSPQSPSQVADSTYRRYLVRYLPTGSFAGGSGYSSFTNEPSVAKAGKNIFLTGNWYAGYSGDNAATWTFLNPFTIFGSGFCCDQVALYDSSHDHVYWIAQYNNHLVVANASSSNLASWCYYNFSNTTIGQASTTSLDFNDAMIGTKDLYLTTNIFPTSGYGSAIVRIPLEQMNSCSGINYNYYSQLDSFTWRLVQGSNDRAYWGSDWDPTGARPNGSSFRLFWWDESSNSISWNNYNINAFAFYVRNSGQNCGSADGVVKNWCQYADSRTLGAYRANGVIGFSMNAKQGGFAPFPYTVREYFRESDLAYLGNTNLYATWAALQFLSLAPNARGHVGGTYYWGGGCSGCTDYYPGTAALVDDDITPSQPWTNDFWFPGQGNTCTYGGLYRWGDYSTTRTADPANNLWIGAGYREAGGNCGTAGSFTSPAILVFGRGRDGNQYARWSNK